MLEQRGRELRSRAHGAVGHELGRQPQPVQPKALQKVFADRLAQRVLAVVAEAFDGNEQSIADLRIQASHMADPFELLLAERRAGLGEESGDRQHARGQLADAWVRRVPGRDRVRRIERVRPGRADLVGPRQDDDRVDRRRMRDRVVHERLEEPGVAVMQVAHQVQHGVGVGRSLDAGVEQRRHRARRRALVRRPETRRIDQRHRFELGRRPADLDALDAVDAVLAEVDRELAVLAPERQVRCDPRGRRSALTRYPRPCRYHVTILVHSPASVAASRSPTRALSSVDLPAFTRPAIATRNGSSSRRVTVSIAATYPVPAAACRARSAIARTSVARSLIAMVRVRTGCRRSCRCPGRPNGPPGRRGRRSAVRRSAAR